MNAIANVVIHESQFPEAVRHDLLKSLRSRKINHKFHYDSVRQTQKWLALHQAYSPARHDKHVRAVYNQSFNAAAVKIKSKSVHVIGLGCGGGQKDARLLKLLKSHGKEIFYTPCDVSVAMVLVARKAALTVLPKQNCFPFVGDLATANGLQKILATRHPTLITFFGMIPNFEPRIILPKLASLLRPKDFLLFSANLSPGNSYEMGMKKILPQYDNSLTREWLMTLLLDLGIERRDGELHFTVESGRSGLKQIMARFHFSRPRKIKVDGEIFTFAAGKAIQLFFSYRYTPELINNILGKNDLQVIERWIARSGEEGVFLCRCK